LDGILLFPGIQDRRQGGIEVLMSFPIVSLYTLKSCSLPLASGTSILCQTDPLNEHLRLQRVPFFS
jgi:hypothetical protein